MTDFWEIGLVLFLVAVNAAFAGSEMALVSLRDTQVLRLERTSAGGAVLARLTRDPNRFLATIQIGITLAGFLASAAAAVSLAEPLIPLFDAFGGAAEVLAILLVTLVLTFFTLVFGELAPKRIAMQHAEGWAVAAARPLDLLATIARPAVWTLSTSTNLVVRLVGGNPSMQRPDVTEEEIRDLVATQAGFTPDAQQVITGAFEVGKRTLREVLVPRPRVFALAAGLPAPEAVEQLVASGHTRAPVFRESLDDCLGVVHLRDLLGRSEAVAQLATPMPVFPDAMPALAAMREMQRRRNQMALVSDEHGGIDGIVTLEDLVEEIVGEIYDEYDRDLVATQPAPDGSIPLPGSFPVHDLVDLGIAIPEGRYATIAGFVLDQMGRIPKAGEAVDADGWRIEVIEATPVAVLRVRAIPRRLQA